MEKVRQRCTGTYRYRIRLWMTSIKQSLRKNYTLFPFGRVYLTSSFVVVFASDTMTRTGERGGVARYG